MTDNELNDTPQRVPKLKSMTDLLRAMNRIHAEARKGDMTTQDLGRYGNFYNLFSNMLRDSSLEERLLKLEEELSSRTGIPTGGRNGHAAKH